MTEALQFRVFLDPKEAKDIDLSWFPDGIPCSGFFALDADKVVPQNFVFACDVSQLYEAKCAFIYDAFDLKTEATRKEDKPWIPLIPIKAVKKATFLDGKVLNFQSIREAWIISNHIRKIPEKTFSVDGNALHIMLSGLQQALLVETPYNSAMNDLYFEIAIDLLKQIAFGNRTLSEYFLSPFPSKYEEKAKKELGLK